MPSHVGLGPIQKTEKPLGDRRPRVPFFLTRPWAFTRFPRFLDPSLTKHHLAPIAAALGIALFAPVQAEAGFLDFGPKNPTFTGKETVRTESTDGSEGCIVVSLGKRPILRWCETAQHYTYEIVTWNEKLTFSRAALVEDIRHKASEFLEQECSRHSVTFAEAQVSLWLSVPDSGMELATPRIGLRLMGTSGHESTEHNLVFSQSWSDEWHLSDSNMHVLGSQRYDTTSGQSVSGVTPQEVMFSVRHLDGTLPDREATEFLRSVGVTLGPRQGPTSRRFLGYTKKYFEQKTVSQVLSFSNFSAHLDWIEPNYRLEAIGERVLLAQFEALLPSGAQGTAHCLPRH